MKKIVLFALLCAFALPTIAQEQEDVVVRRGKYKGTEYDTIKEPEKHKKERTHTDWYNQFRASISIGGYDAIVKNSSTGEIIDSMFNGDPHIAFYYERLKRNGLFYYGPGLMVGTLFSDHFFVYSALYLHGLFDYKMEEGLLGFGNLHIYAGASAGLQLTDFGQAYYNGGYLSYKDGVTLRFYNDIRVGFTIDIGKFSALCIGYKMSLTPSYKLERNTFAYGAEYDLARDGISAMHGVEISFRF